MKKRLVLTAVLCLLVAFLCGCDFGGGNDDKPSEEKVSLTATLSATEISSGESVSVIYSVTGTDNKNVSVNVSNFDLLLVNGDKLQVVSSPAEDTEVTVTVTSLADQTQTVSLPITVKAKEEAKEKGSITVSAKTSSLYANETDDLYVVLTGLTNRAYNWTTSNPELVSIADNILSVLENPAKDTAVTVTATSVADPTVSASCTVTVLAPTFAATLSADSASADDNSIAIHTEIKGYDNTDYTVSVSDTSLVSAGKTSLTVIQAVEADTEISVTVTPTANPSLAVTIPFTVKKPAVRVILSPSATKTREGRTLTLGITVANTENQGYTYSFSPAGILAMDEDNKITVVQSVTEDTKVKITVKSTANPSASSVVTITVLADQTYTTAESEAIISDLQEKISAVSDVFGSSISPIVFDSPWDSPTYYPVESHPRLFFTSETVGEVRKNLTSEANKDAWELLQELSIQETDGILPEVSATLKQNYSIFTCTIIESKAFRYAMTGEEIYGYQAVLAAKNMLATIDIPNGAISDDCRYWGYTMYTISLVYDWCYDLLTETDKDEIIRGCINIIGPEFEVSCPPSRQSIVGSHAMEAQILRDWLSFAIATYGDASYVYEYVGGRIFHEIVPAQNYLLSGGVQPEGSDYGTFRFEYLAIGQWLMYRATDGACELFDTDGLEDVALGFLYNIRPDGEGLRVGDIYREYASRTSQANTYEDCFFVGAFTGNAVLRDEAMKYFDDFVADWNNIYYAIDHGSYTTLIPAGIGNISAAVFLAVNNTAAERAEFDDMSLVRYNGGPSGTVFARSSHEDDEGVMVYMKVGVSFVAGHEHRDAGHFQIYYKGILASDSGGYDEYGSVHDYAYYKQTIAHNSLLVYNPNIDSFTNGNGSTWVYSGGQSFRNSTQTSAAMTLDQWKTYSTYEQNKVIGVDYEADADSFGFAYLAGDLTGSYDAETVDEVKRYMISIMTGDEENPMLFVVSDRISATDASYKKTFLLHSQTEPTIVDDEFVIIENGGGRLVTQSLVTSMNITKIGGEGHEFEVNGVNYPVNTGKGVNTVKNFNECWEGGWGRVELSPAVEKKTDNLLTVMYVTDAGTDAAPIYATEISDTRFVGTVMLDNCVIFPRDSYSFYDTFSFDTYEGDSEKQLAYTVCGLPAGTWNVECDGMTVGSYTVTAESGVLRFTTYTGEITLTPGTDIKPDPDSTYIHYYVNGGALPDDAVMYYNGEKTELPIPTKANCYFAGWYSDEGLTKPVSFLKKNLIDENIDLYAKWYSYILYENFTDASAFSTKWSTFAGLTTDTLHSYTLEEDGMHWTTYEGGGSAITAKGSLATAVVGNSKVVSILLRFKPTEDAEAMPLKGYIHVNNSKNRYLTVFETWKGKMYLTGVAKEDKNVLIDFSDSSMMDSDGYYSIRLVMNFNEGVYYACDADGVIFSDGTNPISMSIKLKDTYGLSSGEELLEELNQELFCISGAGGEIILHEFAIAIGNIFEK